MPFSHSMTPRSAIALEPTVRWWRSTAAIALVVLTTATACSPDVSAPEAAVAEAAADPARDAAADPDAGTDVDVIVDPAGDPAAPAVADEEASGPSAPSMDAAPAAPVAPRPPTPIVWRGVDIDLTAPWERLESSDAERLVLAHPSAAGPGRGVIVMLEVFEGLTIAEARRSLAADALDEARITLFAGDEPALRVVLDGQVIFVTDGGVSVSVILWDATSDLSRDEATRLLRESLVTVTALLATFDPPRPEPTAAAAAAGPAASAATPTEPPAPRLPVRRTGLGPPFPADPPVAIDPGLRLVMVRDFPLPGDRCYRDGEEVPCGDPSQFALGGGFGLPNRGWTYLLPSVGAIEPVCAALLERTIAAGATFETYRTRERQCVVETAHGARIAYVHATLPDGSLLDARVRADDLSARTIGACGEPCPTLVVELRFP